MGRCTFLNRTLRVGEAFSVDNGRVLIRISGQSGRTATMAVAQHQGTEQRHVLVVGATLTVDNGRIRVMLGEQSGRRARLRFQLDETIRVDKPPK